MATGNEGPYNVCFQFVLKVMKKWDLVLAVQKKKKWGSGGKVMVFAAYYVLSKCKK